MGSEGEGRPQTATIEVAEAPEQLSLTLGQPIQAELKAGDTDVYRLSLDTDTYFRVGIEQSSVDVVARLFRAPNRAAPTRAVPNRAAQDQSLITYDRLGTVKPEQVLWVAESPGEYWLEVAAWQAGDAGSYSLELEALRPASEEDRRRHAAELLYAEGVALRQASNAESWRVAATRLQQAIDLWQEIDEQVRQADGTYQLARVQSRWDRRLAIATLESSLDQVAADPWQAAVFLHYLGRLYDQEGEVRQAVEHYRRALPFRHQSGDLRGEIVTHQSLGLAHKMLGELPEALDHHRQALECSRELGDPGRQARALHNLGKALLSAGMVQDALDNLEQALEIREDFQDPGELASTLNAIGQAQLRASRAPQALETQLRALTLSRQAGDRGLEALALSDTALTYQEMGRLDDAVKPFEEAIATYRDLGQRSHQANALHNLGWVLDAKGENARAAEQYRQALELYEATEHRSGRIMTLHSLARVELQNNELLNARQRLEIALAEIERLRIRPLSPTLRYSYFATKQSYYETYIHLLMELHRRSPTAGHDAEALTASERARARSQLDALVEGDIDLRRGAEPELLERDQVLEREIALLELQRQQRIEDGASRQSLVAADRRLRALFLEHDRVQAEIRVASPQYAALTQPQTLTAQQIQSQVVDSNTLLLEFDLGEERSYLWVVTPHQLHSFELPPRELIEKTAARAYKLVSSSHQTASRVQTELALDKLSELLLQPMADLLGEKRLLVVADGALQYIPFGALPEPRASKESMVADRSVARPPLVARHEIVMMPSASMLAVLRKQVAGREQPEGTIALFADPVFELEDPRFKSGLQESAASSVRGSGMPEPRRYERLIYSRREAEDILSLVPVESAFQAIGFAADRESAVSGTLADYRFIHFATHGVLNTAHPGWSRLVLSQRDRQGHKRNGYLFAHEIYNLELAADLVVLSACETALGAEIRGEGLLGLTQGFIYAGAASVLVSLWSVDDQATAELMARFYRHLLVENLRPAAALRAAQTSIRQAKPWQAPYFWAGFVLQGDWR